MIKENSDSIASLRSEAASLKVKGSSDAKKQVQKAHKRAHELENQVENLQLFHDDRFSNKNIPYGDIIDGMQASLSHCDRHQVEFVRQPRNDKKTFQRSRDDKNSYKSDRIGLNALEVDAGIRSILLEMSKNHICLGVDLEPNKWIKDSGCSKLGWANRKSSHLLRPYNGGRKEIFSRKIQNQLGCSIVSIRTDHGREFDNEVQFGEFCNANGITHNFSAPRTPQSNGVVERKNRTLQEMSRTMLNEQSLPQKFWCNAVDTSTYILNRILIRAILGKTPYELLRGRKPTLDYFRVFGSKCFILNTKDYLTKFDPKSYEGVFLGYSQNSKAYIILNKHTRKVEESLNVTFDETPLPSKTSPLVDDDLDEEEAIKVTEKKNLENDIVDETLEIDEIINIKEYRNHPLENVIGNLNQRTLRLVAQGYNQQEGIDYDETYAPIENLMSWQCYSLRLVTYQTNLPSIEDIISSIRINRDGQVRRIRHEEEIDVLEYQVLTREIEPTLKPLEEIIWENVFCLRGNQDHKRSWLLEEVRHSTSSSSAFDQPSSSHLNDDVDDGNEEGTSRASTPSPICYVNSLTNQVP
ncbi:retrovirus-related pol polyprotein from transposon TNT 1-94 [Tanacetum coccineum]